MTSRGKVILRGSYGAESEVAMECMSHNAANTTNIANQWNSPGGISTRSESQSNGRPPSHRTSIVVKVTKTPSRALKTILFDVITASNQLNTASMPRRLRRTSLREDRRHRRCRRDGDRCPLARDRSNG